MPQTIRLQRGIWQIVIAALILGLLGSFAFLKANSDQDVVAVVNGQEITRESFYAALENYPIDGELLGQIVLRQLISEALVAQAGSDSDVGITSDMVEAEYAQMSAYYGPDFEALLQEAGLSQERIHEEIKLGLILDQLMTRNIVVTDEDVLAFYEENKEFFFVPELYRPSQIFVQEQEEAEAILEQLATGASFEEIRKEKSLDESNWGLISMYDEVPAEIADALFSLQVGEVSQPIAMPGGFYLIRLEEIVPARDEEFEEVADEIREHLFFSQAPAVDTIVDSLWSEARVQVNWDRYKAFELLAD